MRIPDIWWLLLAAVAATAAKSLPQYPRLTRSSTWHGDTVHSSRNDNTNYWGSGNWNDQTYSSPSYSTYNAAATTRPSSYYNDATYSTTKPKATHGFMQHPWVQQGQKLVSKVKARHHLGRSAAPSKQWGGGGGGGYNNGNYPPGYHQGHKGYGGNHGRYARAKGAVKKYWKEFKDMAMGGNTVGRHNLSYYENY